MSASNPGSDLEKRIYQLVLAVAIQALKLMVNNLDEMIISSRESTSRFTLTILDGDEKQSIEVRGFSIEGEAIMVHLLTYAPKSFPFIQWERIKVRVGQPQYWAEGLDLLEDKESLDSYVCHLCGGDLLIDEEYHQKNYENPAGMPLEELSVYCADEEECGEAGMFGEIAVLRSKYEKEHPDES